MHKVAPVEEEHKGPAATSMTPVRKTKSAYKGCAATTMTPIKKTKSAYRLEEKDSGKNIGPSMKRGSKTESKGRNRRYLKDLEEMDRCTLYTRNAFECIALVKDNPGISKKDILEHQGFYQQRRVYEALNILEGSLVLSRDSKK